MYMYLQYSTTCSPLHSPRSPLLPGVPTCTLVPFSHWDVYVCGVSVGVGDGGSVCQWEGEGEESPGGSLELTSPFPWHQSVCVCVCVCTRVNVCTTTMQILIVELYIQWTFHVREVSKGAKLLTHTSCQRLLFLHQYPGMYVHVHCTCKSTVTL